MRIYVDDQELAAPDLESGPGQTLAAAIDAVSTARADRLIVEVQADGTNVPPDDLSEPPHRDPYAQELRFVTADPRLLVRETLLDSADALKAIRETQQDASNLIQEGRKTEAFSKLAEIIDVWGRVNQAYELSREVDGLPWQDAVAVIDASGETLLASSNSLNASLQEMQRTLTSSDWSGLADVLAFDMDEQAERWMWILTTLAERAC